MPSRSRVGQGEFYVSHIALLQSNLDRHFEFVKFVEAKCLAFLAASVALAAVAISGLVNPAYQDAAAFLINVVFFSLLSLVLLACAVFPMEFRPRRFNDCVAQGQNFFFFGDSALMTPRQIVKALPSDPANPRRNDDDLKKEEAIMLMLSEQLIINAAICLHKIRLLRGAAFCLVAAVASPIAAIAVWLILLVARERFRQHVVV